MNDTLVNPWPAIQRAQNEGAEWACKMLDGMAEAHNHKNGQEHRKGLLLAARLIRQAIARGEVKP